MPNSIERSGYASIVPLIVCLVGMAVLPTYEARELAQRIALGWGAAVLSFIGAVHWGLALAGRMQWSALRLIGSILPAVAATVAVTLGGQRGLAMLVVGFGVFWLYEHRSVASELPDAYLKLRRNLSLASCALLAVTMILSESAGLH